MPRLEVEDIQSFVLRGYRVSFATFLVLKVNNAAAARAALGRLVADGADDTPRVTFAEDRGSRRPVYVLNLGITRSGLEALEVPSLEAERLDASFVAGAAARAGLVGDVGKSAPAAWLGRLGTGEDHVVLSISATDQVHRDAVLEQLRLLLLETGGFRELMSRDAAALGDRGEDVHFGYRDSISQPRIEGAPGPAYPDVQPLVPAKHFVLLEGSKLTRNGSYGVFRIMQQDTYAFDQLLHSRTDEIDPELLAAKLMGRFRTGTPLSLSPDSGQPVPADTELNQFDFVPSSGRPSAADDVAGLRCPVGSHIRRTNPRGQRVMGGNVPAHRIVRRAMPYGPRFERGSARDAHERGLVGFFINASIEQQFEFIMSEWVNGDIFAGNLSRGSRDPILHADDTPNHIEIRRTGQQPLRIELGSYIQTRGAAYCLLPSRSALRYLARV